MNQFKRRGYQKSGDLTEYTKCFGVIHPPTDLNDVALQIE
jgi:hypothetical protein